MRTICLIVGLLTVTATAWAQNEIYEWTDENGIVHYSDVPPPNDQEATVSRVDPIPEVGTSDAYAGADDEAMSPGAAARERREERAETRAEARAEEERLLAQCDRAQNIIDQLEPRTNIIVQSEDGGSRRMPDDERLRRIEEARDFRTEYCD